MASLHVEFTLHAFELESPVLQDVTEEESQTPQDVHVVCSQLFCSGNPFCSVWDSR